MWVCTCVIETHLWKRLSWPPSPLPHPVPAVSQQLTATHCPPPLHLPHSHTSTRVSFSQPHPFLPPHTDSLLSSIFPLHSISQFPIISPFDSPLIVSDNTPLSPPSFLLHPSGFYIEHYNGCPFSKVSPFDYLYSSNTTNVPLSPVCNCSCQSSSLSA